ncbi:MAG: hypothetical protein B7Y66_01645, partial [Sphingobacteriia bacterium 35-36-14]
PNTPKPFPNEDFVAHQQEQEKGLELEQQQQEPIDNIEQTKSLEEISRILIIQEQQGCRIYLFQE